MFRTLWQEEDGLASVEYALMLALVSLAAISAWTTLGHRVSSTVLTAAAALPGS